MSQHLSISCLKTRVLRKVFIGVLTGVRTMDFQSVVMMFAHGLEVRRTLDLRFDEAPGLVSRRLARN